MRNSLVVLFIALAGAASAQPIPGEPRPALPGPPVPVDASPAMAEAIANRTRMKTPPREIGGPQATYPDDEKALGHAGVVTVRGIVGVDGRLTEATVARSNAGPVLEASALAAAKASTFSPAKDAEGRPIAVVVAIPYEFAATGLNPKFVKWVDAEYPDEERQAGHFGKVVISGRIGADGRLVDPVVKTSSRAPGLDAAALKAAAASQFRAYCNSAGAFVEAPVDIPYAFSSYRTPGKGGGVLRYKCDQFARDQDWWNATWGEERDEFYTMMVGLSFMMKPGGIAGAAPTLKADMENFKIRWARAIETCRKKPDALMIDVFKPEGDFARRLAERGM